MKTNIPKGNSSVQDNSYYNFTLPPDHLMQVFIKDSKNDTIVVNVLNDGKGDEYC